MPSFTSYPNYFRIGNMEKYKRMDVNNLLAKGCRALPYLPVREKKKRRVKTMGINRRGVHFRPICFYFILIRKETLDYERCSITIMDGAFIRASYIDLQIENE